MAAEKSHLSWHHDECDIRLRCTGKHILVVAVLHVTGGVAIHLVHTNAYLLHTQQVDQPRVLPSLSLNLTCLVVTSRDSRRDISFSFCILHYLLQVNLLQVAFFGTRLWRRTDDGRQK